MSRTRRRRARPSKSKTRRLRAAPHALKPGDRFRRETAHAMLAQLATGDPTGRDAALTTFASSNGFDDADQLLNVVLAEKLRELSKEHNLLANDAGFAALISDVLAEGYLHTSPRALRWNFLAKVIVLLRPRTDGDRKSVV